MLGAMAGRETRAEGAGRARRGPRTSEGPTRLCPTCGARYPPDFLVCPKDATALELAGGDDDPLVGEVLAGSFVITRTLGEGGMGRVYEADHLRLPRRFAIKVMLDRLASHPDAVARFEREAQAVARIANPHVLDVVDVLRVQGRPCMVTELLEGEELADVLDREGKIPLARALTLCRQVCRGLAAAHAVGVVHRDLKPSNLFLIDRDAGAPFVKILDFGIAKMADGAQLTRTGMVLGTPAYMAPEQARGERAVDARADVYAVGAVLYHMLTGRPPFEDLEPAVVLTRVLTEDPRRPRDLERSIPEGVETVIQRAMARDPAERPATVLDLDRLLAAFDGDPVVAGVHVDRTAIASAPTMAVQMTPSEGDLVTRRARGARPGALMRALAFSILAGVSLLIAAATALRLFVGRARFSETEIVLVGVLALVTSLFLFLAAARVLVARWRSAPAIERLGTGLHGALLWLVALLGVLALVARGYALIGPGLPAEADATVEVGVLVVPIFVGLWAFAVTLWRARRI